MRVPEPIKAEIINRLRTFQQTGIAEPPYVCISGYPFEGILHTEYGSVRFVMARDAEDETLYIVSRRDYRMMNRRKGRKAKVQ